MWDELNEETNVIRIATNVHLLVNREVRENKHWLIDEIVRKDSSVEM